MGKSTFYPIYCRTEVLQFPGFQIRAKKNRDLPSQTLQDMTDHLKIIEPSAFRPRMKNSGFLFLFLGLQCLEKQGWCLDYPLTLGFVCALVMLKKALQFTSSQFNIGNVLEQGTCMIPVGARQGDHDPGSGP